MEDVSYLADNGCGVRRRFSCLSSNVPFNSLFFLNCSADWQFELVIYLF